MDASVGRIVDAREVVDAGAEGVASAAAGAARVVDAMESSSLGVRITLVCAPNTRFTRYLARVIPGDLALTRALPFSSVSRHSLDFVSRN